MDGDCMMRRVGSEGEISSVVQKLICACKNPDGPEVDEQVPVGGKGHEGTQQHAPKT